MPACPSHMRSRTHDSRRVITVLLILCMLCALSSYSRASYRTDVPLRNWSGFAIHWNWTYDAIKKLVLAGLTDQAVLNTKPMTRLEMARVVAQAIAKITGEEAGQYADREDLEDTLYRLLDEFQPELAGLGVEAAIQQGQPPGFFQIKPLDKLQARTAYSKENYDLENNQGDSFESGYNRRPATFWPRPSAMRCIAGWCPPISYSRASCRWPCSPSGRGIAAMAGGGTCCCMSASAWRS